MTAAPSELLLFDEEAFDLVDPNSEEFESLSETVIDEVGKEDSKESDFERYKAAAKAILDNEMPKCVQDDLSKYQKLK